MNDYDYIITIDEDGSPSLQHALFGGGNAKGSQRQNHKYYARAQDKGRWRYFYSPEEFRAWSSGATRKVKQTVDNVKKSAGNAAGEVRKSLNARRELNEANKATGFGSGLKQWNAQRKYNQTAMGRAENAVRGAVNQATGRARQAYDETRNKLGANASDAVGTARKKIKNLTDAAQEYGNKTLSELRNAAGNARSKAEEVSNAARRKAEETAGNARDKATEAAGRVRKAAEDKSGVTDQKNRDEARRRALMGLDDAVGDYADSDNRYQKSAKGRADKAVDSAKKTADRAREAADEAGDRARDAAGRVRDKVSEVADKARNAVREATGAAAEDRLFDAMRESWQNKNPLKNKKLRENVNKAYDEYDKTPKGRLESAEYDVKYTAEEIRDRIRELADSAGSAAREAAGRTRDAANNAASNVRQKAEDATGVSAKKEMDAQGRKAMMGLDDAIGSFMDAQVRYDNSAAGRTASAKSNAEASLKSAQAAAKKALAKAMDYLPDDQIEEIKDLIRGK